MSAADKMIVQAIEWLATGDENTEVHLKLDLSDGWIEISTIERDEDLIRLTCPPSVLNPGAAPTKIVCHESSVKAVQSKPTLVSLISNAYAGK